MKRFLRILKRTLIVVLSLIVLLTVTTWLYMRQPKFGKLPTGERLARIEKSPHFKNGRFRNAVEKPTLSDGYTMAGELYKVLFKKYPRREPVDSLPSIKTDLKALQVDSNVAVWFGHSSVYLQVGGKRVLVDPSFSGRATPLPWGLNAYKGSNVYSADEMPEIDYLLISHDHYDHLDYATIIALREKVKFVVCGLGVGAHFEHWGYKPEQILEHDWFEKVEADSSFVIYTEPSHHDSGRGFSRGKSLWMSYLIETPALRVYISGDGGYDGRFEQIGKKYGPIDWAIMECGQYDKAWQSVHNLPEEVIKATGELRARNLLPVHHSKFTLAKHPWDEPLVKLTELSAGQPFKLATPLIGEVVRLDDGAQQFSKWWQAVK